MESNNAKSGSDIAKFVRNVTLAWVVTAVVLAIVPVVTLIVYEYNSKRDLSQSSIVTMRKSVLQNRVDNVIQLIEHRRSTAMETWKYQTRNRVMRSIKIAETIYESNKNRLSDAQIKKMIVEHLALMKRANGEPFVAIIGSNAHGILTVNPANKDKDISYMVDDRGRSIFNEKLKEARANKDNEAFLIYDSPKFLDPNGAKYKHLTFVKIFKPFDWVFEGLDYIDELEADLQKEVLMMLAGMRFDAANYIFIDTYDGYALLNNGQFVEDKEYIWNLTDRNGVKIVQEQLKLALQNPKGEFLEYFWYEKESNAERKQLSFVRALPSWKWKIGSGTYLDVIEKQIDNQIENVRRDVAVWFLALSVIWLSLIAALYYISSRINKKVSKLFDSMNMEIDTYIKEISVENADLQERVEIETKQRLQNQDILNYSTRSADMGNAMAMIAHQWMHPLNALAMTMDEFSQNAGDQKRIDELIAVCQGHIDYAVETIRDFASFLKPNAEITTFSLNDALTSVGKLISYRMKSAKTIVELPQEDIVITNYKNDLCQVLINLYSNACDANEKRLKKEEIEEGIIKVETEIKGDRLFLSISDNGGGIPDELIGNIFDAYMTSKGEKGTGLGLYMSRKIAEERLGGTLTAQNTDIGAQFILTMTIR